MDAMTIIIYLLAIIETGALLCSLVFLTRAGKEAKGSEARKRAFRNAAIFAIVYLTLNIFRNHSGFIA